MRYLYYAATPWCAVLICSPSPSALENCRWQELQTNPSALALLFMALITSAAVNVPSTAPYARCAADMTAIITGISCCIAAAACCPVIPATPALICAMMGDVTSMLSGRYNTANTIIPVATLLRHVIADRAAEDGVLGLQHVEDGAGGDGGGDIELNLPFRVGEPAKMGG